MTDAQELVLEGAGWEGAPRVRSDREDNVAGRIEWLREETKSVGPDARVCACTLTPAEASKFLGDVNPSAHTVRVVSVFSQENHTSRVFCYSKMDTLAGGMTEMAKAQTISGKQADEMIRVFSDTKKEMAPVGAVVDGLINDHVKWAATPEFESGEMSHSDLLGTMTLRSARLLDSYTKLSKYASPGRQAELGGEIRDLMKNEPRYTLKEGRPCPQEPSVEHRPLAAGTWSRSSAATKLQAAIRQQDQGK